MTEHKTELIVGIFAMLIFAALTFMTFRVGDFAIGKKKGYTLYVDFQNTAGLDAKTRIKVAGVDAGIIENIELVDGVAHLTLRISSEIKIYSDAVAGIRATGLLGDKYLELRVGAKKPALPAGATIKNVQELVDVDDLMQNLTKLSANVTELVNGLNQPDIKNAMRATVFNLKDITEHLDTMLGDKGSFGAIISRVDSLTARLDEMVRRNSEPLTNTIANLEEFSGSLRTHGPELISGLSETVAELRALLKESRSNIEDLIDKTGTTIEDVSAITAKIRRGEGTLGKLINDEALYSSLTNAAGGVERALSSINRFRTFLTFRGDYLTRMSEAKGGFYLTLQPRPDKFYVLGVVGDTLGNVETTTTSINGVITTERKVTKNLEFTAQFGKRFGDTALRVGLTENTFGVGLDQYLLKDRLKLSMDAWDFGAEEDEASRAHLNIGADYFVFKNVFVSAGLDNILNSNRFGASVGGGLRFEDEDFKYLFGTIPSIPGM